MALRLIEERPGIQQREVVAAIEEDTRLAGSTAARVLQLMEQEGVLDGRRDGRRKAYVIAEPVQPRPAPPWATAAAATEPGASRGSRAELVAVVTALFIAASLIAFVLAPDKDDDVGNASAAPAASAPSEPVTQAEPKPAPRAKPNPKPRPKRRSGALAAAKRTEVAVLSGSAVPGIAGKTGDALKRKGFRVGTVANAPGPSTRSLVLYTRGKNSAAKALAASAKIPAVKPVDPASRAAAPGAGLIVIVGGG